MKCLNPDCRQDLKDEVKACPYCRTPTNLVRQRCANCDGAGTQADIVAKPCAVCRGTGQIYVDPPGQACPECGGSGNNGHILSSVCAKCQGTGWAKPYFIAKH